MRNVFSVVEEVYASDSERVDLVIFLNGLAIMSFELKSNTQGQSYEDAIYQYRTERNPNDRLFMTEHPNIKIFGAYTPQEMAEGIMGINSLNDNIAKLVILSLILYKCFCYNFVFLSFFLHFLFFMFLLCFCSVFVIIL